MMSFKDRMMEALVGNHVLTREQIEAALKFQQTSGGSLQKVLVERGFITESALLSAISQGLGIPQIRLARMKIDPTLKTLLSREIAKQYQLIPIACMGQTLTVAMADPLNIFALDTLTTMTGLSINPLLATAGDIQEAIDVYYGTGVEETLRQMVRETRPVAPDRAPARPPRPEEPPKKSARPAGLTQEPPVVRMTDMLLAKAVQLRASDLLIEPLEHAFRVRYRVDGVLQEGEAPPRQFQQAVVSRIKILAELNIAERRLPQDGHFNALMDGRPVDFRVSVLPATFGERVVLRILDKRQVKLDLRTLGFHPDDLSMLQRLAQQPHGLVLCTGPTGSGKTTTLYSLLTTVDRPEKNLVTVEDPVEFQLEGVNQVTARADIGLTFAAALRSILRQDPDVIMVGEIRDAETADMAVKAALTGHLVLSTLHTNSAAGTVVRLVNMGVEPFLLNSSLLAVIGQRLVRRICSSCQKAYRPPEALAKKFGLVDARGRVVELVKGEGCGACFQSGYRGREVIAEVLTIVPPMRELILHRPQERELEESARQSGMRTLREHGLQKAIAHLTSLDEVIRTTVGESVELGSAAP
ncbi:MAG: Flp pilus assembly complex ATPase component TadA [Candidatus Omnitrophica bacterium]|nr:Flp pilus assembly complex ATPase component TadA [Candidatus Omnitrophota bacterium]